MDLKDSGGCWHCDSGLWLLWLLTVVQWPQNVCDTPGAGSPAWPAVAPLSLLAVASSLVATLLQPGDYVSTRGGREL